jgi:hypothetical protein
MTTRNRSAAVDPESFTSDEAADEATTVVRRRGRSTAREDAATESAPWADETGDESADGQETVIPTISRGRRKIKENRPASGRSDAYFKWPDDGETVVVKFLDTEPWAYNQHWVQREGRKSYPCIGKHCPLCEIGSKVSQKIVYSILNLGGKEPLVQTMEVTPTLDETLVGFDDDAKTGPLPRLYWALSRKKAERSSNFTKYNYSFIPVKERDLEEDWLISPKTAQAALKDAEIPEPEKVVGSMTLRELQDIADEAMGE